MLKMNSLDLESCLRSSIALGVNGLLNLRRYCSRYDENKDNLFHKGGISNGTSCVWTMTKKQTWP
jgi:hypothetical protein